MSSSLNAARRSRELAEVRDLVVDVLVVGLGATGAGAALDAASRGLSVAAIDAHDLAFGTSRWSSKMIHGGLRYLARGQVGVAYESAVERGVLLRHTAPHLVRAHPYLLPLVPAVSRGQAAVVMTGYRLGDGLRMAVRTPRRLLPGPSRISAGQALALAAPLSPRGLRGALLSWDGRLVDDARLVVALARTAASRGAQDPDPLPGAGAGRGRSAGPRRAHRGHLRGPGQDGDQRHRGLGRPAESGDPDAALTRHPPGAPPRDPAGPRGRDCTCRSPARATGSCWCSPSPTAASTSASPTSRWTVPCRTSRQAPEEDVTFLLEVLNSVLETPIGRAQVAGTYAGLRPLLAAEGRTRPTCRGSTRC